MFYRQVQLVAKKHRGPPRYFGKTKSQILDGVMRGNATTFAFIILCSMPVLVYMIHRFVLLDSAVARALTCKSKQIARATADFINFSGIAQWLCPKREPNKSVCTTNYYPKENSKANKSCPL